MGRLIKGVVILVLVGTVYSLPSKTDELQESKRAEIWKRLRTLIERIEVPGKRQYSSYYSSSSSYGSSSYGNSYGSSYGSNSYGNSYGGSYGSNSYGNSYGGSSGSNSYGNSYGDSYGSNSYGNSYGGSYGSNSYGNSYGSSYGSNGNGSSYDGSYGYNSYGYSYGGSYGSNSYGNSYGGSYGSNNYGNSYGSPYGSNSYGNSYGGSYGSNSYGNSYGGSYGSYGYGNSYGGSYGSYGYGYSYGGSYGSGGYINDGPYSGAGLHNGHDQQFGREAIKYVLGLIGDLLKEAVDKENDPHQAHDKCREVQGLLPYDESYMYHDLDGQWRMFEKMGVTLRYLAYTINECSGTEVLSQYSIDYLIDMASNAYQLESMDPYIGIAELEAAYNAEKDYAVGSFGSMWTPECSKVITAFDCNMEQLHEKMVMSMHVK